MVLHLSLFHACTCWWQLSAGISHCSASPETEIPYDSGKIIEVVHVAELGFERLSDSHHSPQMGCYRASVQVLRLVAKPLHCRMGWVLLWAGSVCACIAHKSLSVWVSSAQSSRILWSPVHIDSGYPECLQRVCDRFFCENMKTVAGLGNIYAMPQGKHEAYV